MIVNSVANANADLAKCGAVAAAFAKKGGEEITREFASLGGLKCGQVRATTTSGTLACSVVLHASIRPWDGDRTYKVSFINCSLNTHTLWSSTQWHLNRAPFH